MPITCALYLENIVSRNPCTGTCDPLPTLKPAHYSFSWRVFAMFGNKAKARFQHA